MVEIKGCGGCWEWVKGGQGIISANLFNQMYKLLYLCCYLLRISVAVLKFYLFSLGEFTVLSFFILKIV